MQLLIVLGLAIGTFENWDGDPDLTIFDGCIFKPEFAAPFKGATNIGLSYDKNLIECYDDEGEVIHSFKITEAFKKELAPNG